MQLCCDPLSLPPPPQTHMHRAYRLRCDHECPEGSRRRSWILKNRHSPPSRLLVISFRCHAPESIGISQGGNQHGGVRNSQGKISILVSHNAHIQKYTHEQALTAKYILTCTNLHLAIHARTHQQPTPRPIPTTIHTCTSHTHMYHLTPNHTRAHRHSRVSNCVWKCTHAWLHRLVGLVLVCLQRTVPNQQNSSME